MSHRDDHAPCKKHQSDDTERRLVIPKQLLTISSSLTTALLAATVALYTFAPTAPGGDPSALAPARDQIVLGLLVVSFLFFIATTFSLGWCLYESIPAEKCIRLWGFSWRTSVPGSATMLIFSAALCALLVLPALIILPKVSELSWSWGPFVLGEPQLVRVSVTFFFVFLFWQSIQEIVEPFVRKPPSAAGILYLLLLAAVACIALLRPFLPWAASLGLAAMLFLVAIAKGWSKIAALKRG
jgi:hypothetical protein